MRLVVWLIVIVAVALLVDRLLLWVERAGWINYRRQGLSRGGATYHMLELQSVFNPGTEQVIEVKYGQDKEVDRRECLRSQRMTSRTRASDKRCRSWRRGRAS